MKQVQITITHADGVHTRPASIFVREAGKFQSEVLLECDGTSVNGKSIMGLLMLAMGPGAIVTITATGDDEEEAIQTLSSVLAGSFK